MIKNTLDLSSIPWLIIAELLVLLQITHMLPSVARPDNPPRMGENSFARLFSSNFFYMLSKILKWTGIVVGSLALILSAFYAYVYFNTESHAAKIYDVKLQNIAVSQ